MQKFQRFVADQRWDLPQYKSMKAFIEGEFQAYAKYFFSPTSKIVQNFIIENAGALTVQVNQAENSTLFATNRTGFEDFLRHLTTDTALTLDLDDNATNYVEIQIIDKTCASETVALWDTTLNSGAGGEYTQTIDLVSAQEFQLVSNTVAFTGDTDKLPLATVITAGGSISSITDSRELLFKGEAYNFGSPRTDEGISNIKEMYDAITTVLGEVKGSVAPDGSAQEWYDELSGGNITNVEQPMRAYASATPDAKLNFIAGQITRSDLTEKSVPIIETSVPTVPASTINMQTGGTTGAAFTAAFPASTIGEYRLVGFTLESDGTITVTFSPEDPVLANLPNPGTVFTSGLPIAWMEVEATGATAFKTADSVSNVIENSVGGDPRVHVFGAGGGTGGGTAPTRYPSVVVSSAGGGDATNFTDALALLSVDGGTVLYIDDITVSTPIVFPDNVILLGRGKAATITFDGTGQFEFGEGCTIQDAEFLTAAALDMILASGNNFVAERCRFFAPALAAANCISLDANASHISECDFRDVLGPSLSNAINIISGVDHTEANNLFS